MTKLCPEFSVSLVHSLLPPSRPASPRLAPPYPVPPRRFPPSRHLSRFRSLEFEGELEFVSLSSSVASSVHSPFLSFFPSSFPRSFFHRLIFLIILSSRCRRLSFPSLLSVSHTYLPSLHRAITNCSTKVLRNKRYMRWREEGNVRKAPVVENGGEWWRMARDGRH